jgi:hypothetical protein
MAGRRQSLAHPEGEGLAEETGNAEVEEEAWRGLGEGAGGWRQWGRCGRGGATAMWGTNGEVCSVSGLVWY